MSKITSEHLGRGAYVYIRQSTADQLLHNHESRRRQYGLADRARTLGWSAVEVIDDDLGRSGGGITRPGFERLIAAICAGNVGAVLAIEASRLARNGRDWHTLIEFCGLVGTIIVDEDGIYDPRHPNDRLLLGMKGTMSELELSLFRQRSQEALKQKARRGALFLGVAAGYVKSGRDRIEKDPDVRVRETLRLVFSKFAELRSARQVHIWFREEGIVLPAKSRRSETLGVVWKLPAYNAVHNILDQSDLRRRLCIRAHGEPGQRCRGPQAHTPRSTPRDRRMGRAAEGSARGLHHLRRVRAQSAPHRRQCYRHGTDDCQRRGTPRRSASRGTPALRSLRPQTAGALQRQARPL